MWGLRREYHRGEYLRLSKGVRKSAVEGNVFFSLKRTEIAQDIPVRTLGCEMVALAQSAQNLFSAQLDLDFRLAIRFGLRSL